MFWLIFVFLSVFSGTKKSLAGLEEKHQDCLTASRTCIDGYRSCNESRRFGCQLDTQSCRKAHTDLSSCVAGWAAKNLSFIQLEKDSNELASEWENVTSLLDQCLEDKSDVSAELLDVQSTLRETKEAQVVLLEQHKKDMKRCEGRVSLCQGVVDSVHSDLRCMQDVKNCTYESGKYLCLPRFYTDLICMTSEQPGQEFFHLESCNLLGDSTVQHLSILLFVAGNPWTSVILITVFIFAFIGVLAIFTGALLIVRWCRRRSRAYGVDPAQEVSKNLLLFIIIIFFWVNFG